MSKGISRRGFLSHSALAGVSLQAASATASSPNGPQSPSASPDVDFVAEPTGLDGVPLRWLEGQTHSPLMGTTWGVSWPKGEVGVESSYRVSGTVREKIPVQSWPLAYWPDGSIKWSAHAIAPQEVLPGDLVLRAVTSADPVSAASVVQCHEEADQIVVDTDLIRCTILREGRNLIGTVERAGRVVLADGKLVALHQDQPSEPTELASGTGAKVTRFESRVDSVVIEQSGPVRAVVRIEGMHADAGDERAWLPFVCRLYFYAGSDHIRAVHTFVFDGDENQDFVRGLGIEFAAPMRDATYDRHVRFASAEGGLWAEAVRGVTGLRRNPGEEVRRRQIAGEKLPPLEEWSEQVTSRLHWIPEWGDVTLAQLSPDGFEISKRTKPGHSWVRSDGGTRAAGAGYVGGVTGGVSFGLRNFWQSYPAQIDIRDAQTDRATVTLWLWSPQAGAMDLRFYHDGMGQETHEQQLDALGITYEDYEPGFGTPHGIARTSEFNLQIHEATPSGDSILAFAQDVMTPPQLACWPEQHVRSGVFGGLFDVPDRSMPARARIERNLDFAFDSYVTQREQRRWYGFWNFGDVMHTYDVDRHVWRYDIGGYAWDNSELSTDIWLWYHALRTGRSDAFRFAEAMCRHTGEVDVYHLGRFAGLGTRHNVQHWGCSAKQLRISTAANRRFFYYLTADERTGDLLNEQVNGQETFLKLDPLRKVRTNDYVLDPRAVSVSTGLDWGALAMAWLTHYERTGDQAMREKLINSMVSLAALPFGWFTVETLMDPETGRFVGGNESVETAETSHLAAAFGLMEVCTELIQNFDVAAFKTQWMSYCKWYNASRAERRAATGVDCRTGILNIGHSRLTAWAAQQADDAALASRAWDEFFGDDQEALRPGRWDFRKQIIQGVDSLNPIEETDWLATNDAAQWGLAAIHNLALIGSTLAADDVRTAPSQ